MSTLAEHPIRMRELLDEGLRVPMWGRFGANGELVYCIATLDSGKPRTWSREPQEDAETFALRITRDLQEQHCTGGARAAVLTG